MGEENLFLFKGEVIMAAASSLSGTAPILTQLEQIVFTQTEPVKEWAVVKRTVAAYLQNPESRDPFLFAQDAIASLIMAKNGLPPKKKTYWFLLGIFDPNIEGKYRALIEKVNTLLKKILLSPGEVDLAQEIEAMRDDATSLVQAIEPCTWSLLAQVQIPVDMARPPYLQLDRVCQTLRAYEQTQDLHNQIEFKNAVLWYAIALANQERARPVELETLTIKLLQDTTSYSLLDSYVRSFVQRCTTRKDLAFDDEMERMKPHADGVLAELVPDEGLRRVAAIHAGEPVDPEVYGVREGFRAYREDSSNLQAAKDAVWVYFLRKMGVSEQAVEAEVKKLKGADNFSVWEQRVEEAIAQSRSAQELDQKLSPILGDFEQDDAILDTVQIVQLPKRFASLHLGIDASQLGSDEDDSKAPK
jgi:hypothetical protein